MSDVQEICIVLENVTWLVINTSRNGLTALFSIFHFFDFDFDWISVYGPVSAKAQGEYGGSQREVRRTEESGQGGGEDRQGRCGKLVVVLPDRTF